MNTKKFKRTIIAITFGIILFIFVKYTTFTKNGFLSQFSLFYKSNQDAELNNDDNFFIKLANFAKQRTKENIRYDPSYFEISYPRGDVPENIGVCTDVVIRSYRKLGIDLQVLVHEDMKKNFYLYPKLWRLLKPDPNIDHRRVPNLMTFFKRKGKTLPISKNPSDYKPGDIVAWDLGNRVLHIGIVANDKTKDVNLIVHNIGRGPKIENVLFDWIIIGHFRYCPF